MNWLWIGRDTSAPTHRGAADLGPPTVQLQPPPPIADAGPALPVGEEVILRASPWVSGTRAAAYFGPIRVESFVLGCSEADWEAAELALFAALEARARDLGANAVVGLEVVADPFALEGESKGLRLSAAGTAAKLEPCR